MLNRNINKPAHRPCLLLLLSFLVLLALNTKIQLIAPDGSDGFLLVFLSRLRDSFGSFKGMDMFGFAGIFCLLYFLPESRALRSPLCFVLAGMFSAAYILGRSFHELGSSDFLFANSYQLFLSFFCILGHWLVFFCLLCWAFYIMDGVCVQEESFSAKALWLKNFAIIFLCWLPYLLACYPASFCPDSNWQLQQFFGLTPWTAHHPPLSTAIMGVFVALGELIKNRSFGCFLYVLAQALFGAAVFSLLILQLGRMSCGRRLRLAVLLFYALLPLWGMFAQWFEKDFLYTVFYTLCTILLLEIVWKRSCTGKQALALALLCVTVILLRNNSRYELLPFLIALCFYIKGDSRKRALVSLCSAMALVFFTLNFLYPKLDIAKGSIREMLSIPFQQTARYVACCADQVTDEERAAIDAVLKYDSMAEDYLGQSSDPIKIYYHGDSESLKDYFKVWLQMGLKEPRVYFDALIHKSYGYLAPIANYEEVRVDIGAEYQEFDFGVFRTVKVVPAAILNTLSMLSLRLPGLSLLTNAGFYSWLICAFSVFLIIKKRYYALLPLLPAAVNILVCVASPLHASVRYNISVIATMPLLLWWTVYSMKEAAGNRQGS